MLAVPGARTTTPRSCAPPLSEQAVAFGPDAVPFYGGASSYVNGLPKGWSESSDVSGKFAEMFKWARVVCEGTACDLPGVSIKYDSFVSNMWRAVHLGFVTAKHAEFVQHGLRWGFEVGLHPDRLHGFRFFKNYESATGAFRSRVTDATEARVIGGRTLLLGEATDDTLRLIKEVFPAAFIFPMGAVAKPLEPDKGRPTSDHTRTGLNAATDMTGLSHTLDSYAEMARRFLPGYSAHVSDVEAAFPMLPFAPWVWPFMLHRFYRGEGPGLSLFCHVQGDFGTRGMPGAFKIFFVDVVLNMARAAETLTIPMTVYVDDLAATGATAKGTTSKMAQFQDWAEEICGVQFKRIKDKAASQVQLFLGLWWDSFSGTRTLEERKLVQYMDMLLEFSMRKTLTLLERQQAAGRLRRAIMTMPPGACCLLANIFALMVGLSVAWQKRRTTRGERQDYRFFYDVLTFNLGRGYFTTDRFKEGPTVYSDASRSKRYTGGGWCSSAGTYDWWRYGTAAARKPIDFLEGDTVVHCIESQGPSWRQQWIPFGVDNQSFEKSAQKSWSRAERLNLLLKRLFVLQIKFDCLLRFFWLKSEDNTMADPLSREDGLETFLAEVRRRAFVVPPAVLRSMPEAGRVRNLDLSAPFNSADMAELQTQSRQRVDMAALSRMLPALVLIQATTRGWLLRRGLCRFEPPRRTAFGVLARAYLLCRFEPPRQTAFGILARAYLRPREAKPEKAPEISPRMHPKSEVPVTSPQKRHTAVRRGKRGSGLKTAVFLSMLGCGMAMPARDGYSAQQASVPYPRAILYDGLPDAYLPLMDELMGNRLAVKSMDKVAIAFEKYWKPLTVEFGWPEIIQTDDPERAGKLATFVLRMLENKKLVADSIQTYVWGLRWKMKLEHQADPVFGVMHWHDFMVSVRVRAHVPHEPRRALPMRLILAMLATVDMNVFWEVQFAFFLIILLGTFSRSECPCPKTFTGKDRWNPDKHWMVRDIMIQLVAGAYVLAIRFKAIKQDRRIERPEARGDHRLEVARGGAAKGGNDLSYIGDAPGHELSPFKWYAALMSFYTGPRHDESPFFMAKDRTRPYTYSAAQKDLKVMLARVSPDDTDFGYHGVRVEGWNRASADNADLAEAHGGWKPGNASRYSRFHLNDVFSIFPKMVQAAEPTAQMVACWAAAAPPEGSDGEVEEDEEDDEDEDEEPEPVARPTPGVPPPTTVTVYTDDVAISGAPAGVTTQRADLQAGAAALPLRGQPGVSPVDSGADGPHGYVGAALRMALLSPTSRALARLRRTLE